MYEKALVTGGAGFIGSHLTRALLAEGMHVTVLDDLSMGKQRNVPAEARFIRGDVKSQDDVRQEQPVECSATLPPRTSAAKVRRAEPSRMSRRVPIPKSFDRPRNLDIPARANLRPRFDC